MKDLDDLLNRLNGIYIPIYVKGKEYPGNNPFILNKLNNMLAAGRILEKYGKLDYKIEPLKISDIKFNEKYWYYDDEGCYLYYKDLEEVNHDIIKEINDLDDEIITRENEISSFVSTTGGDMVMED